MEFVAEWSTWIAVVAAGLAALGWLGRKGYRLARMIEAIHYEVKPNNSKSMRDAINRIDTRVATHHDALLAAGLLTDETHQGTDAHT